MIQNFLLSVLIIFLNYHFLIWSACSYYLQKGSSTAPFRRVRFLVMTLVVFMFAFIQFTSLFPAMIAVGASSMWTVGAIITQNAFFIVYFMSIFVANAMVSWETAVAEFFSEDATRFVKNFIRGCITQMIVLATPYFFVLVLAVMANVSLLSIIPVFYISIPLMMFSFFITSIQSFVEEKLFRDVVHRALSRVLDYLDIAVDGTWMRKCLTSVLSGFYFATLHLPTFGVVPLGTYIFLLSLYLGPSILYGWIYESECAEHRSQGGVLCEGIGVTSGMHAMHNCFILWRIPMNDIVFNLSVLSKTIPDFPVYIIFLAHLINGCKSYTHYLVYHYASTPLKTAIDTIAAQSSEFISAISGSIFGSAEKTLNGVSSIDITGEQVSYPDLEVHHSDHDNQYDECSLYDAN